MMAFALPWVVGLAFAAALTITALHLLSVRRPPELLLPTARFLPERDVRAVSRTKRPSDLWLLLLRVALLLSAGLAIAEPYWRTRAGTDIVLVVTDATVVRDTAALARMLGLGNTTRPTRIVYVFADSQRVGVPDVGALLPLAVRSAAQLVQHDATIDSLDLHLFARDAAIDSAAYGAWRAVWPGRVTTHVAAASRRRRAVVIINERGQGLTENTVSRRGGSDDTRRDDVVPVALAWHAARITGLSGGAGARLDSLRFDRRNVADGTRIAVDADVASGEQGTRATTASEDRVDGGVWLSWPANGIPANWVPRRAPDSVSAIAVSGRALLGPWVVTALPADTLTVRPLVWYSDGRVAATERRVNGRCERQVSVVDASAGDVLLSSSANALFDRLLAPCDADTTVVASALVVRAVDGTARAPAQPFRRSATDASRDVTARSAPSTTWVTPLLLLLATLLLVVEWRVRRERPGAAT
jgi:hypothetical protein